MTVLQFASLFNVSGVALVLSVSLALLGAYRTPFFTAWTIGYGSGLVMLLLEALATHVGRPLPLALFETATVATNVYSLIKTGHHLQEKVLSPRTLWVILAAFMVLAGGLMAAGIGFYPATTLPFLCLSASFIWLGGVLIRRGVYGYKSSARWLGWPVILTGILPLIFPVIGSSPYAWAGYWAGGLLNLMVGVGMVVLLLDHTAHQLRQKNEELQELDKLKNNFLSTVSHELRTPLTSIMGASRLLSSGVTGPLNSDEQTLVEMLDNGATRLTRIVNDMIDFTRMQTGSMSYHLDNYYLVDAVAPVTKRWDPLFREAGKQLVVELHPDETVVRLDPGRFDQVVEHLLSNAFSFTPPDGRVTVRVRGDRLEIADNGIGIAPEHHARIFTKFSQIGDESSRKSGGSGLGLSICKAIV